MKHLNKILLALAFMPGFVLAAKLNENTKDGSIIAFLNRTKGVILGVVAALALFFVVWGGIKYITSRGNPKQVEAAKKTLTYAILGLIFVILSQVILNLITGDFTTNIFGSDQVEESEL